MIDGPRDGGDEAERSRLWSLMASVYPPYEEYAARAAEADRTIPVVRVRAH